MNENSLTYRFFRGYLLGFMLAGSLFILPQVGVIPQLLLGLSMGVVGSTWLKKRSESNKK